MMDLPCSLLRPSLAIKLVRELLGHGADIEAKKADLEPRQRCMRDAGVLQQSRSCLKTRALRKRLMGSGNPDQSKQVRTGACKSAGTKEAEGAAQTNELLS